MTTIAQTINDEYTLTQLRETYYSKCKAYETVETSYQASLIESELIQLEMAMSAYGEEI